MFTYPARIELEPVNMVNFLDLFHSGKDYISGA